MARPFDPDDSWENPTDPNAPLSPEEAERRQRLAALLSDDGDTWETPADGATGAPVTASNGDRPQVFHAPGLKSAAPGELGWASGLPAGMPDVPVDLGGTEDQFLEATPRDPRAPRDVSVPPRARRRRAADGIITGDPTSTGGEAANDAATPVWPPVIGDVAAKKLGKQAGRTSGPSDIGH